MVLEKQEFLREFGNDYGYPNGPKSVDEIRTTEFNNRLQDVAYLDHAGATLYSDLQMEAVFTDLTSNLYANPHSQSDSSMATAEVIRECRQQVLDYFNAHSKEYQCIFTSGATSALKIVGEAFPWSSHSCFAYTMENHNSVLGIREFALSQGAAAAAVDVEETLDHSSPFKILQHPLKKRSGIKSLKGDPEGDVCHLFAFPSECNFSGAKFSPHLVSYVKDHFGETLEDSTVSHGQWLVLIDAAKGCSTEPLDLSKYAADFVVMSFYKLFGYPTGLGALLVRNEAAMLLKKTYFSGGTVTTSIADLDYVQQRDSIVEMFEDGTPSFLSIASIRHGFEILNRLKVPAIYRHTTSLATYLRRTLLNLKHEDGGDVCILYGGNTKVSSGIGPTVTFNLKHPDGSWIGYREVEKLASLNGIQLRTGCFCNPGACAKYLGLSHLELLTNIEAGHVCWDDNDIINGKPTGAVRVSLGYMSTFDDIKKLLDFVRSSFIPSRSTPHTCCLRKCTFLPPKDTDQHTDLPTRRLYLKSITIYPLKSGQGFSVERWPLSHTGLRHDREWLLISASGEILTQKKVPEMCLVSTFIDLSRGVLCVESVRCKEKLQISLKTGLNCNRKDINLHNNRYAVECYDERVDSWFSTAVGRPCMLLRSLSSKYNLTKKCVDTCQDAKSSLNFVNEAQLLVISEASVADLSRRVFSKKDKENFQEYPVQLSPTRFRPNMVISGGEAYAEDRWTVIRIGDNYFTALGGCNRCQMINFELKEGKIHKSNEPLATLASYRRTKGKIIFGVLLRFEIEKSKLVPDVEECSWLHAGQEVHPDITSLP